MNGTKEEHEQNNARLEIHFFVCGIKRKIIIKTTAAVSHLFYLSALYRSWSSIRVISKNVRTRTCSKRGEGRIYSTYVRICTL